MPEIHRLGRADARRIAVSAQLLGSPRPTDLLETVRALTSLQVEPTKAVAPSADLVLWSRLGSTYDVADLEDAVAGQRLIELASHLHPAENIALYRAEMAAWSGGGGHADWQRDVRDWVAANDECRMEILELLRQDGPLPATALPDSCQVPWRSSGWTNNRNRSVLLRFMLQRGEVAQVGGTGRRKLWDLATRVYPDDPPVPVEEALRRRAEQRLGALGIVRPSRSAGADEPGERAVIDGIPGEWLVDPSRLGQPFRGRFALLSPFDRLVFDRRRTDELFEFDYLLEMYKPVEQRVWGYYALPILAGDRLVGKLDATADLKEGELRVTAIHQDVPFTKAMTAGVDREIDDLALWLGLAVVPPG